MEIKKERTFAYALAAILFLIGVVCYAAFPEKRPEQPVRVMLKSIGGNVLFDHKQHAAKDGYNYACDDCHHTGDNVSCSTKDCHQAEPGDAPKRGDAFHTQCKGCHDQSGMGPVDCSACHMLK